MPSRTSDVATTYQCWGEYMVWFHYARSCSLLPWRRKTAREVFRPGSERTWLAAESPKRTSPFHSHTPRRASLVSFKLYANRGCLSRVVRGAMTTYNPLCPRQNGGQRNDS